MFLFEFKRSEPLNKSKSFGLDRRVCVITGVVVGGGGGQGGEGGGGGGGRAGRSKGGGRGRGGDYLWELRQQGAGGGRAQGSYQQEAGGRRLRRWVAAFWRRGKGG